MIFQHTHAKVLSGQKTQTRRIVKDETCPYQIGHEYGIQPQRGHISVAHIRVLSIGREDVRQISSADARAEGFDDEIGFWRVWCEMHDKSFLFSSDQSGRFVELTRKPITRLRNELMQRPAKHYDAWILTFSLAKSPLTALG